MKLGERCFNHVEDSMNNIYPILIDRFIDEMNTLNRTNRSVINSIHFEIISMFFNNV